MLKRISIKSRSLRPQLVVAFCLMSVIPILSLCSFIFPSFLNREYLGIIVAAVVALSLFGFLVVKRIVDSIIRLNSDVKNIACGEVSRTVSIGREDEIGELGCALNQLTHHIKDNMDELKIYGERTKDINLQINKQVVALSGVLQIGDLISAKTGLKEIFNITVSRLAQVSDSSLAFIILERNGTFEPVAQYGLTTGAVLAVEIPTNDYIFRPLLAAAACVRISEGELLKILGAKNALVHPLVAMGKPEGVVGIARQDVAGYGDDDIELLDVFAKQLAIAIENDYLSKKVENLEIKDSLMDIFNRRYITDRLDEEILRAISHQRPCALIALKIKGLDGLMENSGELAVEDILKKIAALLKDTLGEFDKAGRLSFNEFCIVLPEKNKKQAEAIATEIKAKVVMSLSVSDVLKKAGASIVVVENPIDGSDSETLFNKAEKSFISGDGDFN